MKRRAVAATVALVLATSGLAGAYPRPGALQQVSLATTGATGNDDSFWADITPDGRYVTFHSHASNLVPGDTNDAPDVFVRDLKTGEIERVSVAADGAQANGASQDAAISADGRYVAFHSLASNLVADDTSPWQDVFVHDRETGATERVSVASDGAQANFFSARPVISADGRFVAFQSNASNLVPGDTNGSADVFVHDRDIGETERVSVASDGSQGNGHSRSPSISADGRFVAFRSLASNLVADDTNFRQDIFVHDREAGETERVSVASDGTEPDWASLYPGISADGRFVAFHSYATNLVPGTTRGMFDIDAFVHDREARTTERVSVASDGTEGDAHSMFPVLSADGRHVAFRSYASNLVPGDTNGSPDIFVHDREIGTTERVSLAFDGTEVNGDSLFPAIGPGGRYVAFDSEAGGLAPGATAGVFDVFVRDRGPSTGIGGLEVEQAPGELAVTGWATFSGAVVASAGDAADDGDDTLGAELTAASVTHRLEEEDLLLRLQVASLPDGGYPGVVYGWSFAVGGVPYEVRALTAAATAVPPAADPHFALYACPLLCEEAARLSGGIGTTGVEVRVALPLEAVAAEPGDTLVDVEAWAALGEAGPGRIVTLDEVALPDASVLVPRVDLGVASADAAGEDVVYDAEAVLVDGAFSGSIDSASLSDGDDRLWARACLGEVCGATAASARGA